ncbi:MAG: zinc ribbon domain-containing protein [Prevotellaceae bacterium]|nr:zinc ribbon domain-containing protein [Prevotellaceae bacterium]
MDTKKCPSCGGEILAAAKKCKHCKVWLEERPSVTTTNIVQNTEYIFIKTGELNLWKKIALIYPLSKRWILDEFILKDGILTVKCKNGKSLQASIKECISTFETNQNDFTWITIKAKNLKIRFGEYAWTTTEEEWEQIKELLNPTESGLSRIARWVGNIKNIMGK